MYAHYDKRDEVSANPFLCMATRRDFFSKRHSKSTVDGVGKIPNGRLSPRKKSVQISRQIGWPTWLLFFFFNFKCEYFIAGRKLLQIERKAAKLPEEPLC